MSVDWFKWLRHEQEFDDLPRITGGPLPTPEDHPDNWDELDFQADLMEMRDLVDRIIDAGPRSCDEDDYFDWDRRRRILQFSADTTVTVSFEWVEPESFAQMWAEA